VRDAYGRPRVDQNGQALMYYTTYDYCGTDKYGFSALPGGSYYFSDGDVFYRLGHYGRWWCAEEESADEAASLTLESSSSGHWEDYKKDRLASVRCLQD